jgi:hypothetical protein
MQSTQLTTRTVSSDPFDGDPFDDDSFFLSEVNRTATVEQRELEALALELLSHPVVVDARAQAMNRFKILGSGAPAEAFEAIDRKMDEWAYHYLLLALNSDPNYPKVLGHGYGPPRNWMGMKVPGCRGLGTAENVDNHYIHIPVDVHSRLELHGKIQEPAIEDMNFWITKNLSVSINVSGLNGRDMQVEDDGTFVVTVDREPANGRPNHLQTTVDSLWLFIRDSRKDWDQRPNAYRVRRLDPPTAPPLTVDELVELARRHIIDDVPANFWFRQMAGFLERNTLSEISLSSGYGGMATQKLMRGRLSLADDEAYVLTLGSGGSDYWVMVLYDWWLMSGNYWSTTSSLNDHQCVANPDGSHTLVFSIQDPGVHNWVDTEGLHDSLFLQRWQMLPQTADGLAGGEPWAKGELAKLDDLPRVLPEGTKWVTAQEREQQLVDRLASFNRRHEI